MESINVKLFLQAGIFTTIMFLIIYSINSYLTTKREDVVVGKMEEIIEDFEDIESSTYLLDYLEESNSSTCDVMIKELEYLESNLWKLDNRIRAYREATKDFADDEFYIREKRRLNRREIIHLSLLNRIKKHCNYNQTVILYFYGECEKNLKCDDQGLVLSYINQKIDPEIVILSFDADRNVSSVNALMEYYHVNEFPCVVIEGHTHCGLHNRNEMISLLCNYTPSLSICSGE